MKKRKNKRKVSKITLILIAFVWMIAIYINVYVKYNKKIK